MLAVDVFASDRRPSRCRNATAMRWACDWGRIAQRPGRIQQLDSAAFAAAAIDDMLADRPPSGDDQMRGRLLSSGVRSPRSICAAMRWPTWTPADVLSPTMPPGAMSMLLPSGLRYRVLRTGTEVSSHPDDSDAGVHYHGTLLDGRLRILSKAQVEHNQ